MIFSILILLILASALGGILLVYSLQSPRRRWRRLVAGLIVLLLVFPTWLFAKGGFWETRRTFLLLVPIGGNEMAAKVIEALPSGTPVAVATLNSPGDSDSGSQPKWFSAKTKANGVSPSTSFSFDQNGLSAAAMAGNPPWRWRLLPHFLPKPTIAIVDDNTNMLSSADPSSISVAAAARSFQQQGVDFFRIDTTSGELAGGRMELSLSASRVANRETGGASLSVLPIDATILLINCRFNAKDNYKIQAWIDRRKADSTKKAFELSFASTLTPSLRPATAQGGDPFKSVVVGSLPTDARTAKFRVGDLTPSATPKLSVGHHELTVELDFDTDISGRTVPLRFVQSTYFQIDERKLIVVDCETSADNLMRRSWVHREPSSSHGAWAPPPTASTLLNDLLANAAELYRSGNSPRVPFSGVSFAKLENVVDAEKIAAAQAAEVLILEPSWEELIRLDTPKFRGWIEAGGALVVVGPPVIPPGTTSVKIPSWLPATAEPKIGRPEVAVQERTDLRLYFLPDASRPASYFVAESGSNINGAVLQRDVMNKVATLLNVHFRGESTTIAPTQLVKGNLSVTASTVTGTRGVALGVIGGQSVSVIPPLMQQATNPIKATLDYRQAEIGLLADLAPSWVATRLPLITSGIRGPWYASPILNSLVKMPTPVPGMFAADLDLSLNPDENAPGTVVVVFAADIDQPKVLKTFPNYFKNSWRRWIDASNVVEGAPPDKQLDPTILKKQLNLIIVPIKLAAGYTAANGEYGDRYRKLLAATYEGAVHAKGGVIGSANTWGVKLSPALDLSGNDAAARRSVDPVVSAIIKELRQVGKDVSYLQQTSDLGRAIDVRSWKIVRAPFSWRHLKPTPSLDQPGKPTANAAAMISQPGGSNLPALFWKPLGQGSVHVLAYNPLAYDTWQADRGLEPGVSVNPTASGWGLQRLIDPIALLPGRGGTLQIVAFTVADDHSRATVNCRFDASRGFEIPHLWTTGIPAKRVGAVDVLNVDPTAGTLSLTISAGQTESLSGNYVLAIGTKVADSTEPIFLRLNKTSLGGSLRARLDRVAMLCGGSNVPLARVSEFTKAPLDLMWLAGVSLPIFVILLLSPAARAWSVLNVVRRLRRRRTDPAIAGIEDEADATAAVNRGGMSIGDPNAQRPAGPILQLRLMRRGDSAAAARKSDWIYFIEEISSAMGSPILPRVLETPREETLSILTLIDLHAGSFVHDTGDKADRQRALIRIAILNCLASIRKSGEHRVAAFQVSEELDDTAASTPELVRERIVTLIEASRKPRARLRVPSLQTNEMVIVVTDPSSMDFERILPMLLAESAQTTGRFACLLLTHPAQKFEIGAVRPAGTVVFFDRGELDADAIELFQNSRAEKWASQVSMADGNLIRLSTDQISDHVATILAEDVWAR